MDEYKYEYECPTERGYIQFSISKKDQNIIFKHRKWSWSSNYEYYVKGRHIRMQLIPNRLGCIASTLLLPLGIIMDGLSNAKSTYKRMVTKTWGAKKYGSFVGDDIYKKENEDCTFNKIIEAKR